jgi:lipopolysaccharide export system permease protein
MKLLDRYLLWLYLKVLGVSFVSLAGLYVVIDGFNNLDEFLSYGKQHAWGPAYGLAAVLAEYYGPRLLQLFDQLTGLLAMLASAFVLTVLLRSNELTALLAAGIPPPRILRPLLAASLGVALLGAANREAGLPRFRDSLSRNAQDWQGHAGRRCIPRYDLRSDILITAQSVHLAQQRLAQPRLHLPPELGVWGRQIVAEEALWRPATADHPGGYLLRKVQQPGDLARQASVHLGSERLLFSPADTPWLGQDECFVASVVTPEQLAVGSAWRQHLSSWELIRGLVQHTIEPGADVRLVLHARLVQPLLDLSLVLLGIPLVLRGQTRNIFVAAGIGIVLVGVLLGVVLVCHALGKNYLLSAALAAWLPLLLFGPLAYAAARPLWD